jgi:hypothetical protein
VRSISSLLLILCLAGCQHGGNNSDAVRQGVMDRLAQQKFNMDAMDVKVSSVQFNGDQADAVVAVALKGKTDSPAMTFKYHLERKGDKWVVNNAASSSGHGGAADPNGGGMNPHGGAMPPATGDNPHGGVAPGGGGGSGMPAPQDLPPAKKK